MCSISLSQFLMLPGTHWLVHGCSNLCLFISWPSHHVVCLHTDFLEGQPSLHLGPTPTQYELYETTQRFLWIFFFYFLLRRSFTDKEISRMKACT
jgi:hypothetical protein